MENRLIGQQLGRLKDRILLLGGATETSLSRAVESLVKRNSELAQKVLVEDKIINEMELEIDRMSIEIIALYQPAAHDLRFVIAVAKITPILERIADHACNIAESALVLNAEPPIKEYIELPHMAQVAAEMLRAALDAFTTEDSDVSRRVIERDLEIDASYHKVFNELLEMMIDDPTKTTSAAHLLFVAKHLERIGDYVKDICELNVYLREAVFIKHSPQM